MLNKEVQESINESVLCWLATVNEKGEPNVSPKEMFVAYEDEYILVANIASPKSVRNILVNASVCLSFINIFKQKGFKVNGTAKLLMPEDLAFSSRLEELRNLGGEQFNIKSIIEVHVDKVTPILAPSYALFKETTESSQVQQAMIAYGVQPRKQ